ncbi:MAG: hypothetical protein HWD85_08990 [Flavobacteriaceae bacterium]|nr:hypothetical protein [Flavobacteriaceae bacterium]
MRFIKNGNLFKSYFISFSIPLLMIVSMIVLSQSSLFFKHPRELSIGITLDLVLTIPLVYFLLIRKKKISKTTVVSFFGFGILVASFIIPKDYQTVLSIVKKVVFPIIELGILAFLFIKTRSIVLKFRKNRNESIDFFTAIELASKEVFPKRVAALIATEAAMIYYLLFDWKKQHLQQNEFTNYKESGVLALLLGIVLVLLIETFALHIFLLKWSVVVAWVLTFLSVYTILQFISLAKSMTKRPHLVDAENNKLILRYGFFAEAVVPFQLIKGLEVSSKDLPENKSVTRFSPLGELVPHNIILHLKEENKFVSLYGFTKKYTSLAFFVDNKLEFKKMVEENCNV